MLTVILMKRKDNAPALGSFPVLVVKNVTFHSQKDQEDWAKTEKAQSLRMEHKQTGFSTYWHFGTPLTVTYSEAA